MLLAPAQAGIRAGRATRATSTVDPDGLRIFATTTGYEGSPRNFRRLVAVAKQEWRRDHRRGRRPAVWAPGEVLAIDWGAIGPLHVFCAVLAWSRVRFVRFADNERSETTLGFLAECFEELGGVPKTVLADRMGCLKGGVVANKVVPTAEYVRLASYSGRTGARRRTRSRRESWRTWSAMPSAT